MDTQSNAKGILDFLAYFQKTKTVHAKEKQFPVSPKVNPSLYKIAATFSNAMCKAEKVTQ